MPKPSPATATSAHKYAVVARVIAAVVIIFILIAAGSFLYLTQDDALIDDAKLRVPKSNAPDTQNGFLQLDNVVEKPLDFEEYADAHGIGRDNIQKLESGELRKDDLVSAFLAQAQPELDKLAACLTQPYFEQPGPIDLAQLTSKWQTAVLNAGATLALKGQNALNQGDWLTAVAAVAQLHNLAARLTQGYPSPMQILLAAVAAQRGDRLADAILNNPATPSELLRQLAAVYAEQPIFWRLATQRSLQQGYENFACVYDRGSKDLTGLLASKGTSLTPPPRWQLTFWRKYSFQPNRTHNQAVEFFQLTIRDLDGPYAKINRAALAEGEAFPFQASLLENRALLYIKPNILGKIILALGVEIPAAVIQGCYQMEAEEDLLTAGLALRRYYAANQTLPPQLTDLVPQYLAVPLTDPYDGKPLHYDSAKELVYSVGTELKDEHGSHLVRTTNKSLWLNALSDGMQPTLALAFLPPPPPAYN